MIAELDTTSCDMSGILPAQMSVGVRWNGDTSGPRALMLAVLEDAVRCIEQGRRRRGFRARRLGAEAEAWVRSDSRAWPFSFANILRGARLRRRRVPQASLGDGERCIGRAPHPFAGGHSEPRDDARAGTSPSQRGRCAMSATAEYDSRERRILVAITGLADNGTTDCNTVSNDGPSSPAHAGAASRRAGPSTWSATSPSRSRSGCPLRRTAWAGVLSIGKLDDRRIAAMSFDTSGRPAQISIDEGFRPAW